MKVFQFAWKQINLRVACRVTCDQNFLNYMTFFWGGGRRIIVKDLKETSRGWAVPSSGLAGKMEDYIVLTFYRFTTVSFHQHSQKSLQKSEKKKNYESCQLFLNSDLVIKWINAGKIKMPPQMNADEFPNKIRFR